MKDSKHLADWILKAVAEINPYSDQAKTLALSWAVGFLARCCAEMIWSDNRNLALFRKIHQRNSANGS
jgi:hypothetical protein